MAPKKPKLDDVPSSSAVLTHPPVTYEDRNIRVAGTDKTTYEDAVEKLKAAGNGRLLCEHEYPVTFSAQINKNSGRDYFFNDGKPAVFFFMGEIAGIDDGTALGTAGNQNFSEKPISASTCVRLRLRIDKPSEAPLEVSNMWKNSLVTLDNIASYDEDHEEDIDETWAERGWRAEFLFGRKGALHGPAELITVVSEPIFPRPNKNSPTSGARKRVRHSRKTDTQSSPAATDDVNMDPDHMTTQPVGGLYPISTMPDADHWMLRDLPDSVAQLNIRNREGDLVRPWEYAECLKPGTLVIIAARPTCYVFEGGKSVNKVYMFVMSSCQIVAASPSAVQDHSVRVQKDTNGAKRIRRNPDNISASIGHNSTLYTPFDRSRRVRSSPLCCGANDAVILCLFVLSVVPPHTMLDRVLGFLGRLLPDDIPTSDDADESTTDNETPAGFENLPLFHASTLRSIEIGHDNTGNIAYFDKPSAPSSLHLSRAKETTVKRQKLTKADRSAVLSSRKVIATSSESEASEDSVTSGEGNLRRPWNPRPDGQFTRKVSRAWPADIPGSRRAEKPEDGWHSVRKCLGVMKCHGRDGQLSRGCPVCHGKIIEHKCRVKCESWVYRTGAIFKHHGIHHHDNAPAIHLSQREDRNFQQIVHEHPRMGPVKLLTGRPGINGPGDSVANISPVLDNPGRIQYERRKLIKPAIRLNSKYFLPALEKLRQENPEWTISYEGSNGVQLVILQSNWQRRMAVKNSISTEAVNGIVTDACHDFISMEAVNGIVTDACHDFFTERTHLLFLSSTFEAQFLKCWIPILICFSNGASAEHYRLFFAFLFAAIVARCKEKGIKFTDEFLANVVDFSQAQSKGFSGAYVDLRRSQGSKWTNKTDSELAQIGGALLKGCLQHFSNQITRVAKISHVVPPGQQARFRELAQRMLRAKDLDQLHAFGNDLMTAFEHATPWAEWWLRADHARMLFAAAREMDPAIAMSLPDTTNAAEAMNSRIYAMAERKNQLIPGLAALIRVGDTFERRYYAAKAGNKIFYGADPQHWKKTKAVFGYTKHTRHQSSKKTVSDGRPPDTIATLQAASRKGKKTVADQYQRAYKWDQHSCSIDSSLTAIYSALSRDPTWIRRLQDALPMPHIIHSVAMLLEKQISQSSHTAYEPNGCAELTRGRDLLRLQLVKIKAMRGVGLSDSILQMKSKNASHAPTCLAKIALSLFRAQAVIVKKCQGESPTATEHWEVTNPFWRSPFRLSRDDHKSHGGDLEKWMRWVMLPKQWTAVACWRQADGGSVCAGLALSKEFIIGIPIVLTVELGEDGQFSWIIPSHLAPLGPTFATAGLGVRYSLCAVIFTNHTEKRGDNSHFFTRYHMANSNAIYDYDGMKHAGHAIRLTGKKLARWMTGLSSDFQSIPEGYRPMAIVYHLDGGETAQRVFLEQRERTAPCGLQLGRSLSTDRFWTIARLEDANHLEELTVDERGVWAGTRHRAETREYTRDVNSSPVKLTKRDHEKGLKSLANHLAAPSKRIMITDTSSESDKPIAVRKARRKITKTAKVQSTPERTEPEDKRQPFSDQHRETRLLQPKSYTSSLGIPHVRKTRDLRPNFAKSSQSDDSVNEFLLKSAAFSSPKAAPSLSEDTDSETPCILNCCSCGELGLDDTDDMHVFAMTQTTIETRTGTIRAAILFASTVFVPLIYFTETRSFFYLNRQRESHGVTALSFGTLLESGTRQ
ncbi:hypothetical protein MIND_01413100 [Mycena indigotica]|uniref:C2H2-type domain-containing protein n=1 Tax=Mycena indigotica TaxID=2126181 RepID=A0A8H6RWA6_9AGAR|nr:uncharacterized protein MIND_01413100 [Mycena indigotica]KAF7288965.1 hypothetical protein MIND_01413100 [Mycena indigotica]